MKSEKEQNPDYDISGTDSLPVVQQWKEAGWQKDSHFLKSNVNSASVEPDGGTQAKRNEEVESKPGNRIDGSYEVVRDVKILV